MRTCVACLCMCASAVAREVTATAHNYYAVHAKMCVAYHTTRTITSDHILNSVQLNAIWILLDPHWNWVLWFLTLQRNRSLCLSIEPSWLYVLNNFIYWCISTILVLRKEFTEIMIKSDCNTFRCFVGKQLSISIELSICKNKTLIAYSRFGWKWNIRSIINCLIEFISQQMIVGRIQYKQLHIANAIIWCCVGKWKVIGLSFTMNCMIVVLNEEIGDFNHNWYWEEGVVAAAIHSILYKFVLAWRTFFENCTESIQKPCFVWAKAIVSYILSAAVFDETIRMGLSMISKMNVCWITSTDYSIMWQGDITYYIHS